MSVSLLGISDENGLRIETVNVGDRFFVVQDVGLVCAVRLGQENKPHRRLRVYTKTGSTERRSRQVPVLTGDQKHWDYIIPGTPEKTVAWTEFGATHNGKEYFFSEGTFVGLVEV